jgi:AraC-like DNA-binding protein
MNVVIENRKYDRMHNAETCLSETVFDQWGQFLTIHPGLQLRCMELTEPHHVAVDFQRNEAFLEFGCMLSGRLCGCARLGNGRTQYFEGGAGQTWCAYQTKAYGTIEYLSGQTICVMLFLISGPLLKHLPLFQPGRAALSARHSDGDSFSTTGKLTPAVRPIVQQIMRINKGADTSNHLLLMSKAYELLFHLSTASNEDRENIHDQEKRQAVKRAQDILNRNLTSPPTLADLARQSGLCVTNLTREFRKQFGTTVFGYLRRQRLARAKELITLHDMSASEAAWEVGYSSLSSFHRAFFARYGATPGSYGRKT